MSGGDRGKRSKTELVAFAAIALVFIIGNLAWAVPEHLSYSGQAADNASYHERWATDQIGRNCVPLPPTAFNDCVEEARATSEERQREERDLEAQRKMALWTAIMGAMATIGVGLSGFGVYLIWRTWDATREAADNSRSTLDSYIHKERAILRIANAHFQFLDDMAIPAGYQAQILNFGASPGEVYSVSWEYLRGPSWPEELRFEMWPDNNISVPKEPAATPHLGCEDLQETGMWLAIKIIYTTLGKQTYCSHRAYKLGYDAIDGYGASGYYAAPLRIANQPSEP